MSLHSILKEFDFLYAEISGHIKKEELLVAQKKYERLESLYNTICLATEDYELITHYHTRIQEVYDTLYTSTRTAQASFLHITKGVFTDFIQREKKYVEQLPKLVSYLELFHKHHTYAAYALALFLVLSIGSLFFIQPALVGFVALDTQYSLELDTTYSNSTLDTVISYNRISTPQAVRVTGETTLNSSFRIYVEDDNGSYLVFSDVYLRDSEYEDYLTFEVQELDEEVNVSSTVNTSNETEFDEDLNATQEPTTLVTFETLCVETCNRTLSNNFSLRISVDYGYVDLDYLQLTESVGLGDNVPPILVQNFTDIKIRTVENHTLDSRDYFEDPNGDLIELRYHIEDIEYVYSNDSSVALNDLSELTELNTSSNISVAIDRSFVTFSSTNFTGSFRLTLIAFDGTYVKESNPVYVHIVNKTEIVTQHQAVIGQPVIWTKEVFLLNDSIIAVELPDEAYNITTLAKNETTVSNVSNITIVEASEIKDLSVYEAEKEVEILEQEIILQEIRKELVLQSNVTSEITKYKGYQEELKDLEETKKEKEGKLQSLRVDKPSNQITGQVVDDLYGKKGVLTKFSDWILSASITGAAVTEIPDSAYSVTVDQESYSVGDTVTITLEPANANYTLYVFSENDSYVAPDLAFVPTLPGAYTVSVLFSGSDSLIRKSTEFFVFGEVETGEMVNESEQTRGKGVSLSNTTLASAFALAQRLDEEKNESIHILLDEDVRLTQDEVIVNYSTPGPQALEFSITEYKKQILVTSEVHYENILTYTNITPTPRDMISLYWVNTSANNTRNRVIDVTYIDADDDGRVEQIQWITPHLSNQTYEVELDILNVQSYPYVSGNWTIRFLTTGVANLTFTAINDTTYSNVSSFAPSAEGEGDDLEILKLTCGTEVLYDKHHQIFADNVYFYQNTTLYSPNATLGESYVIEGMKVLDYNCSEQGNFTTRVHTYGVHNQQVQFGEDIGYANNFANNKPVVAVIRFADGLLSKVKTFLNASG